MHQSRIPSHLPPPHQPLLYARPIHAIVPFLLDLTHKSSVRSHFRNRDMQKTRRAVNLLVSDCELGKGERERRGGESGNCESLNRTDFIVTDTAHMASVSSLFSLPSIGKCVAYAGVEANTWRTPPPSTNYTSSPSSAF